MVDLEEQILTYEACPELFDRMDDTLEVLSKMGEVYLPQRAYPLDPNVRKMMVSEESPIHFDTLSNAIHCTNAALYQLQSMGPDVLREKVLSYNKQHPEERERIPTAIVRMINEGYAEEVLYTMAKALWGPGYAQKKGTDYTPLIKIVSDVLSAYVKLKKSERQERTERKITLRNLKAITPKRV